MTFALIALILYSSLLTLYLLFKRKRSAPTHFASSSPLLEGEVSLPYEREEYEENIEEKEWEREQMWLKQQQIQREAERRDLLD